MQIDIDELIEFAENKKRSAEGSCEECCQERDNEEQALRYEGQYQAWQELIDYLNFISL